MKLEFKYYNPQEWTLEKAGRFWDSVADYDEVNQETHSYFRRFTDGYRLCSIADQSYILDICSRTGNGTLFFFQRGKVRAAVCADVSERMLETCRQKFEGKGLKLSLVKFSSYPLPFPDNEFDAVLCFETLEHLPQPGRFLQELCRVLMPKGELLLTTPNPLWEPAHWLAAMLEIHHSEGPHKFLSKRSIAQLLEEAGFRIEREDTTVFIPAGPSPFIALGNFLEKVSGRWVRSLLGLRRIFVCKKI